MANTFIFDKDGDSLNIDKQGRLGVVTEVFVLKDYIETNVSVNRTYTEPNRIVSAFNDGAAELRLNIHDFSILILPGEAFEEAFEPFTELNIEATDSYRATVKG